MLLDAHAHVDKYGGVELDDALREISERGILTVSVSMDPGSYRRSVQIASRSRFIVPTFGVHPWNAHDYVGQLDGLRDLIAQSPMIGEVGLDYHFVDDASLFPKQRRVFEYFLREAVSQNKTVNLHTKGAESDVLAAVQSYRPPRIIIHWYSGPIDILRQLVKLGTYFTVGVEVSYSDAIRQLAREIPDSQLLTETDNPGAIRWLRGVTGMPADLEDVLTGLARVRNSDRDEVAQLVRANFLRLVDEDPHLSRCEEIADWRAAEPGSRGNGRLTRA